MSQSTVAPRRPVYQEPAPLNRRIYFGAVVGVTVVAGCVLAIPGACAELLVGLLELIARWMQWLVFALVIYMLGHCSTSGPGREVSQSVQASQPAQSVSGETQPSKHRRRAHPVPSTSTSSAMSTASSVAS